MSTVIVFELPVDLFRSCLVPFLDLRSVVRLDTSTLNFNMRTSLHHKLSGYTLPDPHYSFYKTTASMLQWLSRRRAGLKKMWLHDSVTDPDVLHVHPTVTKALVDVRLSAQAIIALLSSCSNLEKLNLVSTSAHCGLIVTEIAKHCPLLSDINMVNGIASDTDIFLLAQRCRALRALKLKKCDWVTDAAVEALARYLPGLQQLSLHCQDKVTDAAIIMLMRHCTAMTVLELDYCNLLTDAAVLAIANAGASLTYLDLYGCTAVTDVGVTAIAYGCPKLTGLCLAGRKQLSDASIILVAQRCTALTSLNLCYCYGLTDASLFAMTENWPALCSLLLLETYSITTAGVNAIRRVFPRMLTLRVDSHLDIRGDGFLHLGLPPPLPPSMGLPSFSSSALPATTSAIPSWARYPSHGPGSYPVLTPPPPPASPRALPHPPQWPLSAAMEVEDLLSPLPPPPPPTPLPLPSAQRYRHSPQELR